MQQLKDPVECIQQGLYEFLEAISITSPLPFASFQEFPERIFYTSGLNFATCNGIVEKTQSQLSSQEMDTILQQFSTHKLPFIWWRGAPALEAKSFQFGGALKGIYKEMTQPLGKFTHFPKELEIRYVTSEKEIELFTKVAVEAFGMPLQLIPQFAKINNASFLQGQQRHYLAFWNGKPAAGISLSLGKTAGIWNFATYEEYRRKGIGTCLAYVALQEAQKLNYKDAMAILMPKGLAWGLFQKFGFEEKSDYPFYIWGADPSSLEK